MVFESTNTWNAYIIPFFRCVIKGTHQATAASAMALLDFLIHPEESQGQVSGQNSYIPWNSTLPRQIPFTLDGIFTIHIICMIITRGAHYRFLFSENPRLGLTTETAELLLCHLALPIFSSYWHPCIGILQHIRPQKAWRHSKPNNATQILVLYKTMYGLLSKIYTISQIYKCCVFARI